MRLRWFTQPLKSKQGQIWISSKGIGPFHKYHNIAIPAITIDKYSTIHNFYQAPKYPIVLCHGFSGFDKLTFLPGISTTEKIVEEAKNNLEKLLNEGIQLDYWHGIKEALENIGSKVLIAKVPPFGKIEHRARTLEQYIIEQCDTLRKHELKSTFYGHQNLQDGDSNGTRSSFNKNDPIKVNMISHSMGGLDSRYLISKLQNNNSSKPYKVVSLTTISTPHHGSECADFVENLVGNSKILRSMCPEAIFELTTSYAENFNKKVVDDPNVKYFSYAAKFDPKWFNLFNLTWHLLRYQVRKSQTKTDSSKNVFDTRMDNDGMVSVHSSMWGEYMGTLDQVDHLDLINWTNRLRVAIDKLILNKEPHFNAIALYLDIANNLSKRGF